MFLQNFLIFPFQIVIQLPAYHNAVSFRMYGKVCSSGVIKIWRIVPGFTRFSFSSASAIHPADTVPRLFDTKRISSYEARSFL